MNKFHLFKRNYSDRDHLSEEMQNNGQYKRENLLDPKDMPNKDIYNYLGTVQGKFTELVAAIIEVRADLSDHKDRAYRLLENKLSPRDLGEIRAEASQAESDSNINWNDLKSSGIDDETHSDRQASELMGQVRLALKSVSILKYASQRFPNNFQRSEISEIREMSEACSRDVGVATNLANNNTVIRLNQMKFNKALEDRGDHLTAMYADSADQGPGSLDDVD